MPELRLGLIKVVLDGGRRDGLDAIGGLVAVGGRRGAVQFADQQAVTERKRGGSSRVIASM